MSLGSTCRFLAGGGGCWAAGGCAPAIDAEKRMAPNARIRFIRPRRLGVCDRLAREREPAPILRQLPTHGLIERVLDPARDRPGRAVADHAAVDFADRRYFDGG